MGYAAESQVSKGRNRERRLECGEKEGFRRGDGARWEYILSHYGELEFSPTVETEVRQAADNPKRRQRNARKQLENIGVGTKAQQALQKQREEMKTERREISREQREAEKQRQFEIRQQKRKEKHRGH